MNDSITIFLFFCFNFHEALFIFEIEVFSVSFCNLLLHVIALLICVIVVFKNLLFILEFCLDLSKDLDILAFAFSKLILPLNATTFPCFSGSEDPT